MVMGVDVSSRETGIKSRFFSPFSNIDLAEAWVMSETRAKCPACGADLEFPATGISY
jgi:hypothetical protein